MSVCKNLQKWIGQITISRGCDKIRSNVVSIVLHGLKVGEGARHLLTIERKSVTPLYEQIYQYLKSRIEHGQYAAGSRLPSVRSLAGEVGVSKITVEQAYLQLAAEGYIKAHDRSPYEVLPLPILLDNGSHLQRAMN